MTAASLQPAALNPLLTRPAQPNALPAEAIPARFEEELRGIAEEFVGMTFFAPLLEQARDSVFRVERFHGGYAEDTFASQLDAQLALRMSRRDRTGLVDTIVDRYLQNEPSDSSRISGVDLNA